MASITIRNLDDQIKEQLRIAAAHNGHSMEEEARLILGRALAKVSAEGGLGSRIRKRFSALGDVDLDLPSRDEKATAADLFE
ncbi:plasmid stabilization protein [Pseudomonas sp. Cab53]|uniref:FitA-like ribbon-helix-helix domain-containing protein n=1 Tax=Pseudomonas sp. Cab53 TaxID=2678258 RepID=UPI001BB3173D|nr:plasmid stabilization protein [Pseudomonas sp. Cab53]BBP63146.1 plasmid stabilization protein [Pseudomonas sp. Cab53]